MQTPRAESAERAAEERRWSEWMARAQGGDREAYEKLMAELAGVIEAFVRARFGGSHASDFVEECVQESLLALHRVRHSWNPRQAFRPWLFAVVRHKVIDLLRRATVRRSDPLPEHDPVARTGDPAATLDGARLLGALEPAYRDALVLTKLEGCSIEEAAARAGVSPGAMKTRVHRALRRVQKRLAGEELP